MPILDLFFLELGPWSEWSDCSLTCNGGDRSRRRICGLDPTSKSKDNPCKASLKETEKCNTDKCPVFTEWSDWTTCSKTCGNGDQKRGRECVAATEASTRLFCQGALEQTQVGFKRRYVRREAKANTYQSFRVISISQTVF